MEITFRKVVFSSITVIVLIDGCVNITNHTDMPKYCKYIMGRAV
jgi:hypothetical protein